MIALPAHAAGGIALGATRVIYPAEAKQTSLAITNSHKQERYLINAWIENDRGQKEKSFVVTPPLFVSEPDSENTLRIIYAGPALAVDRESLFYLNVKAIPSVDKASVEGKNVLQLAVLSRIKVFVRPGNLAMQPEEALSHLRFERAGNQLVLECFIWGDFSQQARLRVAAKAVVRPEDDVRAITGGGNLREFLFQLVRMLYGDFDAGVFFEFFTHFSQAVIAFVAVNPDNQLTFFDLGQSRGGNHHCCQGGQCENACASLDIHICHPFW
jgi:hypothetical protein